MHVIFTIIGRCLKINEICICVGLESMKAGLKHTTPVLAFLPNFVSSVELLLKHGSDHSKGSQRSPASLKFTAPANSVALAFNLHISLQKLSTGLIVVKVHERNGIFRLLSALSSIASINECSGEGDAEIYVVRASRPLKSFGRHSPERSIASTVFQLSAGTSSGHGMGDSSTGNGVDKTGFSGAG